MLARILLYTYTHLSRLLRPIPLPLPVQRFEDALDRSTELSTGMLWLVGSRIMRDVGD